MSASESNEYGSAHDPLCCIGEGKFDGYCQCELIARVREDERAAALRDAMEAVSALEDENCGCLGGYTAPVVAATAIEALRNSGNRTNEASVSSSLPRVHKQDLQKAAEEINKLKPQLIVVSQEEHDQIAHALRGER